jgi:Skp family chaperone for outer membrane proteins
MLRFLLVLFALWACPLWAETPPAPASATPKLQLLIVDVKTVLDESKAAIGAQKKIEVQRSAFQDEISIQEKHIREAEQELLQQRSKLDEKAYADKENQLRQKFRDVEKYVQERRQTLEKATSQSLGKVHDVMLKIVADIAKKRGAQAVLAKQVSNVAVLWSMEGSDITSEVSARLNTELPELAVNIDNPDVKKEPAKQ